MKIVKHRNLMGLFFAIFMMLPMIAIGVRCAYITFNKNAKDSYYGETINEEINTNISYTNLLPNNTYLLKNNLLTLQDLTTTTSTTMNVSNVLNKGDNYDLSDANIVYFRIRDNHPAIFFYRNSTELRTYNLDLQNVDVTFTFLSFQSIQVNIQLLSQDIFYTIEYNEYSYLDNAFIYSVHEITDNNLGQINFFTFFANMFLDLNNPKTQTYVNFVNWYFNYMLLVSLAYLLFFVIMWFINYIRQLLEKGNTLGHGGF